MTALSKATLKATWVANFKPQASDFANLIDSWTDYYAGLEALGAAVAGGSFGTPVFNNISTVTFVSAVTMVPTIPTSSQMGTAGTFRVFFKNTQPDAGLYQYAFGDSSAATHTNRIELRSYSSSAGTMIGNQIRLVAASGSFASPGMVPYGATISTINNFAHVGAGSFQNVAQTFVTTYPVTAGAMPPTIMGFEISGIIIFTIHRDHIELTPTSEPANPNLGAIYYDENTNKLRCYNGTSWNDLF